MTIEHSTLTGPDLGRGITLSDLAPNGMLLGHANGEAVLLSRNGDDVFAISAHCSHYGGPLAEGVLDGETIRCPWHHACFSVRTGEALRAPALSPVACWQVEQHGGKVMVTNKIERDPLAPTMRVPANDDRITELERVVIVGAGAAGSAAAEMLRRSGFDGEVTLVDVEEEAPYDRPNVSKDFLAGNAPEAYMPLRPEGFYAQHDIYIMRGRVTSINPDDKSVSVAGHDDVLYSALLLATGAEPIRLDVPGENRPHVHYLRTLTDGRAVIAATETARCAVVVGASFIGLEVAASLRARGLDVHVVAPDALPLERVLGPQLGAVVRDLHEKHGVSFHLGHTPVRIDHDAVVLDDGTRLLADLVVVGVGVHPRLELATAAGIALDRGVLVNEYLETSVPGIFAAGDIARWPDPHSGERIRVEHWALAQRMGQAAARNILGARERFAPVPFFWSRHYDMSISYVGHAKAWDAIRVESTEDDPAIAVTFERDGQLLALATVERDELSLHTEQSMERVGAVRHGP
ncbi:FAD-dependent oxidoreductase [Gemmatimonas sp.]|uniref:FAD-dependent oxidoreductase n=1 Tax=Gemmatimonas sp. TaxID=1962908 RepID=UPI003982FAA0